MLTQWQVDPDLAGLRESSAINRLSTYERKECLRTGKRSATCSGAMRRQVKTGARQASEARTDPELLPPRMAIARC